METYTTGGWGGRCKFGHRHAHEEDEYARDCPLQAQMSLGLETGIWGDTYAPDHGCWSAIWHRVE